MAQCSSEQLQAARSLLAALRIIEAYPECRGKLKLSAGSETGTITFSFGRITSALIEMTGENGLQAVNRMLRWENPIIRSNVRSDKDIDAVGEPQSANIDIALIIRSNANKPAIIDNSSVPPGPVPSQSNQEAAFFKQDEGLTLSKLKVLRLAKYLRDEKHFQQPHHELNRDAEAETAARLSDLLSQVPRDGKPFDRVENLIHSELGSLTDEQLQLMRLAGASSQGSETFAEIGMALHDTGLSLREDELWQLSQFMASRPEIVQKQEFAEQDERLQDGDKALFHAGAALEEPAVELPVDQLEAIPAPRITDADRAPLVAFAEPGSLPQSKRLGGRIYEFLTPKLPISARVRRIRKRLLSGRAVGVIILALLLTGTVTLPRMIRSTATQQFSDEAENARLTLSLDDDVSTQPPSLSEEKDLAAVMTPPSMNEPSGLSTNGSPDESAQITNSLGYARQLLADGKTAQAVFYYEDYLKQNPASMQARIELIKAYILMKDLKRARTHCLTALKLDVSVAETEQIWALLRQCMRGQ